MFEEPKEKPRSKRRVLREEDYNREGHWIRSFTVRQEVWPTIESWATEHRYRLTALKGKRRTYEKTVGPSHYRIHLEMKQIESEFTLTCWIVVGLSARAMYLFFHPSELPIEPSGYKGSVIRRKTCHELNQLLERLKQPAIAGSLGFHISDLDGTSRVLGGLMLLPIVFFLLGTARHIDPNAELTKDVFILASRPLGAIALLGIFLMAIHNFVVIKKWNRRLFKNISTGGFFALFSIVSAILFSQVNAKMDRNRFLTYCFKKKSEPQCNALKEKLSKEDREWILNRMNELQKELTIKPQ